MFNEVNETIWKLWKLQNDFQRPSLLIISKSFIRQHLDYGNIICDQAYNACFQQNLEGIQYNAALANTGALRGISKNNFFKELGLESLQHRRWHRKLCWFCKILKGKCPKYLFNVIPKLTRPYFKKKHK